MAAPRSSLVSDHAVVISAPLASSTGTSTLLEVTLRANLGEREAVEHLKALFAHSSAVQLGGHTIARREVAAQASKDLGLAELLAFPLIARKKRSRSTTVVQGPR